jgi:Zn-dependent protease with chaperone function
MNYVIFILLFLFLSNYTQILRFATEFKKNQKFGKKIKDHHLMDLVKKKTGLHLDYIAIFDSDKPFGLMPGLPKKPHMVLSKNMHETFNKNELEWVVLHEAGHCLLYHTVKIAIVEVLFVLLGIMVITYTRMFDDFLGGIFLAISLSLLFVQIVRAFEWEADHFAATRMGDLEGMVTGTDKLIKAYQKDFLIEIRRQFLGWNILPEDRIFIATREYYRRQSK